MEVDTRTTSITLSFNSEEEVTGIQITRYLKIDDPEEEGKPFDKHTSTNIQQSDLTEADIVAVKKFLTYADKL